MRMRTERFQEYLILMRSTHSPEDARNLRVEGGVECLRRYTAPTPIASIRHAQPDAGLHAGMLLA